MVTTSEPDEPSVAELLPRARAGDAPAYCRLIEPLRTGLLRQAVALCGDVSLAEDLVSETLVEGWKSLQSYNETCRLSTWLCAILLHRHQKARRRAGSRPPSLARMPGPEVRQLDKKQQDIPSQDPSPAEIAISSETSVQLRRSLELLSEKHRRVIWLRFFEEASLPEIAAVLDCSLGTVKSRLHHALDNLRKMKMNLPDLKGDKRV